MARQARAQCKQLSWVVYAETFLAVVAFSYITMLCVDQPEEDFAMSKALSPAFPTAVVAKLDSSLEAGLQEPPVSASGHLGARGEEVVREEGGREKPRCETKLPAFTTTFVIAFMAGGFMNVERIQGLPIP